MKRELVIDSFAGGGGASLGIALALGREPDVAINHDADAIAMHAANHPACKHYTEDVWKVSPRRVTRGRRVGLLWASPDCKHFSRAKGGKPVEKSIRSLAWVVVKWAAEAKPRLIVLENVREFEDWGPLIPRWECRCGWRGTEGQAVLARTRRRCPSCDSPRIRVDYRTMVPDPDRRGLTFRRFVGRLRGLGYVVEWQSLNASDYGAPTHRRRLFLIARRDGEPIVWPEPTHGDPRKATEGTLFAAPLKPWRTAAECIDWSLPCPSIFTRKRPLAEKTMRRIAMGIKRYVLENPKPFIVRCNHGGDHFRGQPIDQPSSTLTASRGDALVTPLLARLSQTGGNGTYTNGVDEPLTSVVSKAEHLLVSPVIVGVGGRAGQSPPTSPEAPLGTVTAKNDRALVVPILAGVGGAEYSGKPKPVDEPASTVMPQDRRAVVAAYIAKHFGGATGCKADEPLPTTTARGTQNQLVTAFLSKYHGQKGEEHHCTPADEPARTVDTQNRHGLVAANLVHLNHGEKQWSGCDEPTRTVTTGNHAALVYSFLVKYFGTAIGTAVDQPMPTVTPRDRFGLVTVTIDGEPYVIVDIGMRMLTPRELARAQGFPDSYVLTGTKTSQVARVGNSVAPAVAQAIVAANYEGAYATKEV